MVNPLCYAYNFVIGQQARNLMTSPMMTQTLAATGGSVLGSAIESALSQSQQLGQYGMVPTQAGYSPAQLMAGGAQTQQQQQQAQQSTGIATASGLTPESILQAYSGVQGESVT